MLGFVHEPEERPCRSCCSIVPPAPDRRGGGRPPPFRATPAPARPRRRDGTRRLPPIVTQRQFGYSNLGITSVYSRRAPMIPVTASLRLSRNPAPAPLARSSPRASAPLSSEAGRKQQHGDAGSARRPECRVAWTANVRR